MPAAMSWSIAGVKTEDQTAGGGDVEGRVRVGNRRR